MKDKEIKENNEMIAKYMGYGPAYLEQPYCEFDYHSNIASLMGVISRLELQGHGAIISPDKVVFYDKDYDIIKARKFIHSFLDVKTKIIYELLVDFLKELLSEEDQAERSAQEI